MRNIITLFSFLFILDGVAFGAESLSATALPQGGKVVGGNARIHYNKATPKVTVTQTSPNAYLQWQSMNLGKAAALHFAQPSSKAVAYNQILAAKPSTLAGQVSSNGIVVFENPHGLIFKDSFRYEGGGLIAATLHAQLQDVMRGHLKFKAVPGSVGGIVFDGQATLHAGGLAAFVAPWMQQNGKIIAPVGAADVGLLAGDAVAIDPQGDGLLKFEISEPLAKEARSGKSKDMAFIEQNGTIDANGGAIVMSVKGGQRILHEAINVRGRVRASAAHKQGGKILITGGETGGKVTLTDAHVEANSETADGGVVQILGEEVHLQGNTIVEADSRSHKAGTIFIGGAQRGKWSTGEKLMPDAGYNAKYVKIGKDVRISAKADQNVKGAEGGRVILYGDGRSRSVTGPISAKPTGHQKAAGISFEGEVDVRGYDGGFVELSGKGGFHAPNHLERIHRQGHNLSATGHLLIDPSLIIIGQDLGSNGDDYISYTNEKINAASNVIYEGDVILFTAEAAINNSVSSTTTFTATGGTLTQATWEGWGNADITTLRQGSFDSPSSIASGIYVQTPNPLTFSAPGASLTLSATGAGSTISFSADNPTIQASSVSITTPNLNLNDANLTLKNTSLLQLNGLTENNFPVFAFDTAQDTRVDLQNVGEVDVFFQGNTGIGNFIISGKNNTDTTIGIGGFETGLSAQGVTFGTADGQTYDGSGKAILIQGSNTIGANGLVLTGYKGSIRTVGDLNVQGPISLGTTGAINAGGALSSTTGNITLSAGAASSFNNLQPAPYSGAVSYSGAGNVTFAGLGTKGKNGNIKAINITSTGTVTFSDAIYVGDLTINGASEVDFNAVGYDAENIGAASLSVTTAGDIKLHKPLYVSGKTTLNGVSITGDAGALLYGENGAALTTTGAITLPGGIQLQGGTTSLMGSALSLGYVQSYAPVNLTSTSGNIALTGSTDGNSLNVLGNVVLNSAQGIAYAAPLTLSSGSLSITTQSDFELNHKIEVLSGGLTLNMNGHAITGASGVGLNVINGRLTLQGGAITLPGDISAKTTTITASGAVQLTGTGSQLGALTFNVSSATANTTHHIKGLGYVPGVVNMGSNAQTLTFTTGEGFDGSQLQFTGAAASLNIIDTVGITFNPLSLSVKDLSLETGGTLVLMPMQSGVAMTVGGALTLKGQTLKTALRVGSSTRGSLTISGALTMTGGASATTEIGPGFRRIAAQSISGNLEGGLVLGESGKAFTFMGTNGASIKALKGVTVYGMLSAGTNNMSLDAGYINAQGAAALVADQLTLTLLGGDQDTIIVPKASNTTHKVNTLIVNGSASSHNIRYAQYNPFTISSASGGGNMLTLQALSGALTLGGNIEQLNGNVALYGSSITQSGGTIQAKNLALAGAGAFTLSKENRIGNLLLGSYASSGAFTPTAFAGTLKFHNSQALTLPHDMIMAGDLTWTISSNGKLTVGGALGPTTHVGTLSLTGGGIETLGQGLLRGKSLTLDAATGGVTAGVNANTLEITNAGKVDITALEGLVISGISDANGITLAASGPLTLTGDIQNIGHDMHLTAVGGITQSAGTITDFGGQLTLRNTGGNITVNKDNAVKSVVINNEGSGTIDFKSTEALTLNGVSTGGDITVASENGLTIPHQVVSRSGAIALTGGASEISGKGQLTSPKGLTLNATAGGITLDGIGSAVTSLTIGNNPGAVVFHNTGGPLTINGWQASFGQNVTIATGSHKATFVRTDNKLIDLGTGDFTLIAADYGPIPLVTEDGLNTTTEVIQTTGTATYLLPQGDTPQSQPVIVLGELNYTLSDLETYKKAGFVGLGQNGKTKTIKIGPDGSKGVLDFGAADFNLLLTADEIILNKDLRLPAGKLLSLHAQNGKISGPGKILGNVDLQIYAAGQTLLTAMNELQSLTITKAAGEMRVHNLMPIKVQGMRGVTAPVNVSTEAMGITLSGSIDGGDGDVLFSGGNITAANNGLRLAGSKVSFNSLGTVDLMSSLNTVLELGASSAAGQFKYASAIPVTVGKIQALGGGASIDAGQNRLSVAGDLSADSGTITLKMGQLQMNDVRVLASQGVSLLYTTDDVVRIGRGSDLTQTALRNFMTPRLTLGSSTQPIPDLVLTGVDLTPSSYHLDIHAGNLGLTGNLAMPRNTNLALNVTGRINDSSTSFASPRVILDGTGQLSVVAPRGVYLHTDVPRFGAVSSSSGSITLYQDKGAAILQPMTAAGPLTINTVSAFRDHVLTFANGATLTSGAGLPLLYAAPQNLTGKANVRRDTGSATRHLINQEEHTLQNLTRVVESVRADGSSETGRQAAFSMRERVPDARVRAGKETYRVRNELYGYEVPQASSLLEAASVVVNPEVAFVAPNERQKAQQERSQNKEAARAA